MAIRFKRKTAENWKIMNVRVHDVAKAYHQRAGRIMFPTSHDLVPTDPSFEACIAVLGKLLRAGNQVLVTTKPHLSAIERICSEFYNNKDQIQFRFTITSFNDDVLKVWEPGAPSFCERVAALEHAHDAGFQTSISCEPALCSVDDIVSLYGLVKHDVTGSFWIGTMNHCRGPVKLDPREIYSHFHDTPKIRFKDSITTALGITNNNTR